MYDRTAPLYSHFGRNEASPSMSIKSPLYCACLAVVEQDVMERVRTTVLAKTQVTTMSFGGEVNVLLRMLRRLPVFLSSLCCSGLSRGVTLSP